MNCLNMEIYDELLRGIRNELSAYSLKVLVVDSPPEKPTYPVVVLSEIANNIIGVSTDLREVRSVISYEVDIYAKNLGTKKTKRKICEELTAIVDEFMFKNKFLRAGKSTSPVVDTTLYRITLRYSIKLFNNKNQLY